MRLCCAAVLLLPVAAAGQSPTLPSLSPPGAPRVAFTGRALEFTFPGLRIGVAEYDEGPTGVTVFHFPERVVAAVDVRGGAPGTMNTDALRLAYTGRDMDAIVFAGGSWHGLAAATGVADEIRVQSAATGSQPQIAGVVAAIINDLSGARRFSGITPDDRLGRAALIAARPGWFPLGARGAGRFAMLGASLGQREPSGQGGAFRDFGATKVAVFTVVNAGGFVVDRLGQIVRCRSAHFGEPCSRIGDLLARRVGAMAAPAPGDSARDGASIQSDNTTITLVVTNQKLERWALERLAVQVHTSMARAIQPFATSGDGDVLYAVTTAAVDNPNLSPAQLALAASELAWDAVLSAMPDPDPDVVLPPPNPASPIDAFIGEYILGPGARLTVRRTEGRLVAESDRGGMYVPNTGVVTLIPVAPDLFQLETPRRDRVRFERDRSGRVIGLTINPGQWSIAARRTP